DSHVVWENHDETPHTVTTDDGYVDQINGPFDTLPTIGLVAPGESWEFTFTKVGTYAYHCEPHPWMQGEVEVIENFA
ncbi:MAG TPA: plastocyanin/azurin family copper-binding protein, partial [Nitrososphaera sp.]